MANEDLAQSCGLLHLFFKKLIELDIKIEESWIRAVRYVLTIDSDEVFDLNDPEMSNFCCNVFLFFEEGIVK